MMEIAPRSTVSSAIIGGLAVIGEGRTPSGPLMKSVARLSPKTLETSFPA